MSFGFRLVAVYKNIDMCVNRISFEYTCVDSHSNARYAGD